MGAVDVEAIRRMWPDVLTRVYEQRRSTWTFVSEHAQVLDYDGKRLQLGISTDGLLATFRRGPHAELVRQALIDVLGVDAQVDGVRLETGGTPRPSAKQPGRPPGDDPGGPAPTRDPAHSHGHSHDTEVTPRDRAAAAARSWDEPPPAEAGPDSEPEPTQAEAQPRPTPRSARAAAAAQAAAAQAAGAPDRAQPHGTDSDESDEPHPDDPDVDGSGLVGQPVVEQLLGGRVITDP